MKLDAEGKSIERPSISVYFNEQIQKKDEEARGRRSRVGLIK